MDEMMKEAIGYFNKHINEAVDFAINLYTSPLYDKNEVISGVVCMFIHAQLSALGLESIVHNPQFNNGKGRFDMNAILENMGNTGVRIGAFAYVLAIKLEAILLEDNSTVQDVAAVEALGSNEYRFVGMAPAMPGFKLSNCYRRYIEQDQFVADLFMDDNS